MMAKWSPPEELSRDEIVAASNEVLAMPDVPLEIWEDIFPIEAVGMEWDIACEIHEPADRSRIPRGPDEKKVGILLLHGGMSDHRYMRPVAKLMAGKFGCKVVAMSFPGRCYLDSEDRDWPGDTINPDGTVRTPHWSRKSRITPDQYELIQDRSDPVIRRKRGTVFLAKAKEGTEFYCRMAGWPVAFEVGGIELCKRHFPPEEYTVYGHGRSTGGPFINMLSQRIPNFAGIGAMENSPFGYIYAAMTGQYWKYPFYCLAMRTWRDIARYRGPENGLEGAMRLPMLMEEIFEEWEIEKRYAQFKAESIIHFNNVEELAAAARATAKRLGLNQEETEALVARYQGYTRELAGPDVKPVPPIIFGVAEKSVDHSIARYKSVVLPMYAAMEPAPKVSLVAYHAGTHSYTDPEPDLPMGCGPATAKLWLEAIMNGYYSES